MELSDIAQDKPALFFVCLFSFFPLAFKFIFTVNVIVGIMVNMVGIVIAVFC